MDFTKPTRPLNLENFNFFLIELFLKCFCETDFDICEEGYTCVEFCYKPAYCSEETWEDYNVKIISEPLQTDGVYLEKTQIQLKCFKNMYNTDYLANGEFVEDFIIECGNDGVWVGLTACEQPSCQPLKFNPTFVDMQLIGSEENSNILEGSVVVLECKEHGHRKRRT